MFLALAVVIGVPTYWVLLAVGAPWPLALFMAGWAGWNMGGIETRRERRKRQEKEQDSGHP